MLLAEFPVEIFFTPFGIPIIAIISVFTWLIVASISEQVGKVMRHKANTDLKLELMARGLSSEEIVRIVEAGREYGEGEAGKVVPAMKPHGMPGQV